MILFRFIDLPEEIGTMVIREIIKEYKSPEILETSEENQKRKAFLKELSILNSIFRKPAQVELFRVINLKCMVSIRKILGFITINPCLGLMIESIYLHLPEWEINLDLVSENELAMLLNRCPSLTKLKVTRLSTKLDTLARAEGLQLLILNCSLIKKSLPSAFQKLKHLHLSYPSTHSRFDQEPFHDFPVLVTLTIDHFSNWIDLRPLYSQILNLAVFAVDLPVEFFQEFSNLVVLDVFATNYPIEVIRILSSLPSIPSIIRLTLYHPESYDWTCFTQWLLESKLLPMLKLREFHLDALLEPRLNLLSRFHKSFSDFQNVLERNKIKLALPVKEALEDLDEWMERVKGYIAEDFA